MTTREEFDITLNKLENSLVRVNFILDCLLQLAEQSEHYELCEKILSYKKIISLKHIVDIILRDENPLDSER